MFLTAAPLTPRSRPNIATCRYSTESGSAMRRTFRLAKWELRMSVQSCKRSNGTTRMRTPSIVSQRQARSRDTASIRRLAMEPVSESDGGFRCRSEKDSGRAMASKAFP